MSRRPPTPPDVLAYPAVPNVLVTPRTDRRGVPGRDSPTNCTASPGSPPAYQISATRLVLVPTPWTLATPRSHQTRFRLRRNVGAQVGLPSLEERRWSDRPCDRFTPIESAPTAPWHVKFGPSHPKRMLLRPRLTSPAPPRCCQRRCEDRLREARDLPGQVATASSSDRRIYLRVRPSEIGLRGPLPADPATPA